MAQHGGARLSDQDVEKLYAEFLEWNRRVNFGRNYPVVPTFECLLIGAKPIRLIRTGAM
jgi:hypothetical protein